VASRQVVGKLSLKAGSMPQDVKLSPDGKVFYVADMHHDGIYLIDGEAFKEIGFWPTGKGAHGLYASRDSKVLYVSKSRGRKRVRGGFRDAEGGRTNGSFQKAAARTWAVSRRMGKVLWLAGRYSKEVYAIDTTDGHLLARIPVGKGPHGLCVYPQPGRYSLGHTGVFR